MRLPVVVGGNRHSEVISTTAHHGNDSHLSRILSGLDHFDLTGRITEKDPIRDGHGGYSDVFVGCIPSGYLYDRRTFRAKDDNVKVAIKTLRVRLNQDIRLAKTLAREMAVWSKLDHPNILPFLGYMFEKDYPSLISEWMELGTARQFLRDLPEFDITTLALGIAEGLQYMHARGIVHSDIKADNILINPSGSPLICDFGISRMLDASESRFVSTTHDGNVRGSARWMAAELYVPTEDVDPKHTKETDVWAYGMTLYELVTKELPYNHIRQELLVMLAVCRGELPRFPDLSSDESDDTRLREVCSLCWAKSARERPSMSQIIQTLSSFSGETTADYIEVPEYSDERVPVFPLQAGGSHPLRYELPMSMGGEGAYMEIDDAYLNDREQSLFQRDLGNTVQSGLAQEQQTATLRSGAMSHQHQQLQRHDVKYWPNLTFPTMSRERFMFMLRGWWKRSGIEFDQQMITIGNRTIDLHQLHMEVLQLGGAVNVKRHDLWGVIAAKMGWNLAAISEAGRTQDRIANQFKVVYEKLLETFQQTYMAAAMKQSLTTPPQPPTEHHGTSNQPTAALNQPRSQQPLNSRQVLPPLKLASMSAEEMRAQGYPGYLIEYFELGENAAQIQRAQAQEQQRTLQQQGQLELQQLTRLVQQEGTPMNPSISFPNQLQNQGTLPNSALLLTQSNLLDANALGHPELSAGSNKSTELLAQQRPQINVHQGQILPHPQPLPVQQGPSTANFSPSSVPVPPYFHMPSSTYGQANPAPLSRLDVLASVATPSHLQTSPQAPKSPKIRAPAETRPIAWSRQTNMKTVPSASTISTAATSTTGPNASMPAAEPAPSPAQASLAEKFLKRSRDELVGQEGSAGTEGMTHEGTPLKRIRTNWESTPDAEPSKHQTEAEGIKTTEDAAKFYSDMTQILELSNVMTLSPEGHETLAQLVKRVGHGIEIPDTPGSSSLSGLPNAGTSSPKVADSNDFFQFLDCTAFKQEDEKADTLVLAPTSSTDPSPESGTETDHPGVLVPSGSINDRTKIADAADSEPKVDFFDTGCDTLRLGIWGEIDDGGSGYFSSSDYWKWEVAPASGDNPWAIST